MPIRRETDVAAFILCHQAENYGLRWPSEARLIMPRGRGGFGGPLVYRGPAAEPRREAARAEVEEVSADAHKYEL